MNENDVTTLIDAMKGVFATKEDLDVFPTADMVKRGFDHVDERFDRIENLLLADHKRRIEKLEAEVKELRNALAM